MLSIQDTLGQQLPLPRPYTHEWTQPEIVERTHVLWFPVGSRNHGGRLHSVDARADPSRQGLGMTQAVGALRAEDLTDFARKTESNLGIGVAYANCEALHRLCSRCPTGALRYVLVSRRREAPLQSFQDSAGFSAQPSRADRYPLRAGARLGWPMCCGSCEAFVE